MIARLRRRGGATTSDTSPELLPLDDQSPEREEANTQIIGQEMVPAIPVVPETQTVLEGRELGKGKGNAGGSLAATRVLDRSEEVRGGKPSREEAEDRRPEGGLQVTPVRRRRNLEDGGSQGVGVEEGIYTGNSGYQSMGEMRPPVGPPIVLGPTGVESGHAQPLFDQEQLARLRELQMQAQWMYQRPWGEYVPPQPRPESLELEEKKYERARQERELFEFRQQEKELLELKQALRHLQEENREVKKKLKEQQDWTERLTNEKDNYQFRTPEEPVEKGGKKSIGRSYEEELEAEAEKDEKEAERGGEARSREEKTEVKPEDVGPMHFQVMLKLMGGMQALQHKLLEEKDGDRALDAEAVQSYNQTLPELGEWDPSTGPIDLGDWLALIEPIMSDLSKTSAIWWTRLNQEASEWYERHQQLPPLSRLSHDPVPSNTLKDPKRSRLEKRAATMLLRALPQQARDEMVSTKRLSAFAIVCQLLKSYQPGGLGEKELVLKSLESPLEAATIGEAVTGLRKLTRWRRRASELQITEPDPFLLLKGLNRLIRKPLESNRDLAFRINLARSTLQVDATPTSASVTSFASHLLAECEQVAHQEIGPTRRSAKDKEKEKAEERAKAVRMKKFEEEGKGQGKGKDYGKDGSERGEGRDRYPCRFFNSESGCKKGRDCRYLHEAKDEKRRCYNCGSLEHLSPSCARPREGSGGEQAQRPKAAKIEGEDINSSPAKENVVNPEDQEQGATMKNLLEEANKMLKSLTTDQGSGSSAGTTTATLSRATSNRSSEGARDEVMNRLQKQLDELRLKTLRISRMAASDRQGLLDSGATHALRPLREGEDRGSLANVRVTLADGGVVDLKMNSMGTMVVEKNDIEPIVPMGALTKSLGCRVLWEGDQVRVEHPMKGELPVRCEEGCPLIPRGLALDLIQEIEDGRRGIQLKGMNFEGEIAWMKELVASHPALRGLPERIRNRLVVSPGEWRSLPGNRRLRKKWKRDGLVAHWFSGKDEGFTLSRAMQQQGGDHEAVVEVDILRDLKQDLLEDGGIYAGFIRVALDGRLRGMVGGPNCRTRSVLRHYEVPDWPEAPRPIRKWGGEEHGLESCTDEEKKMIEDDDLMMWRMIFVFMVAEYLRQARREEKEVKLALEQPASPRDYRPEVVSWWDTSEWKKLAEEFSLKEYTFNQGDLGGAAKKPTTFGGNLALDLPDNKGLGSTRFSGPHLKSKDLARWSPGTMVMVTKALRKEVFGEEQRRIGAVSWEEHLALIWPYAIQKRLFGVPGVSTEGEASQEAALCKSWCLKLGLCRSPSSFS